MSSIDERIVSIAFENGKFEAGIAKTMATLTKLDETLKKVGTTSGFSDIDKNASKVTFSGLQGAIEKIKDKLNFTGAAKGLDTIESQSSRITFAPLSSAIDNIKGKLTSFTEGPSRALDSLKTKLGFAGADKGLNDIEAASSKVRFAGLRAGIETVKEKLRFSGAAESIQGIDKAASRVRFEGMTSALDSVGKQFGILEGVASVALGNIVSKAALSGGAFLKSFSFGPIKQGLDEYATNLQSIQTILANTKFQGSTLKDVNGALKELNTYSDQTIYNFSEMAKNIGTFTAAGVDLKTSTESIKGIANLAALSGSNSQQASTAMYQLSQAIASGKVGLQDWNSVVNAGMGGATFQRALAETASQMGTISEGALKIDKATGKATINGETFRDSIMAKPGDKPWLTSEVLTSTLKQFTGDLTDAQLAAMGFDAQQIKSIQATAKTAKEAATQVKTLGQVFDVAKETIGSGWSQTFQLIFGDFDQAKKTFTALSNTINGFINTNSNARNKVLSDWSKLGGRKVLIEGIKDVFQALIAVVKPVRDAFREIFPAKTGKDLFELTQRFRDFAESLKIGPETATNLKRTFAGFFAVLDIGKQILGQVFGLVKDLFGAARSGSGGFLDFTGSIGDFLVAADKALKQGDGLTRVFDKISSVLTAPIKILKDFAKTLSHLFDGDTGGGVARVESSFGTLNKSLSPLQRTLNLVTGAFKAFFSVLGKVGDGIRKAFGGIGDVVNSFGDQVANAFKNANYDNVFSAIQTTLIGGIFLTIKKALGGGANIDLGGGFLKEIGGTFKLLNNNLAAMQKNLQADTLLKIASAIGVLAAGVTLLSLIDPKRLASAMTAVTVGLGELFGTMVLLNKVGGFAVFSTMPIVAASMIGLAAAIDILAISVVIFSKLSWNELAKGLTGVGGALAAISLGSKGLRPALVGVGPGLIAVGIALNLIAVAVKIFSTLKWEEIAKGLLSVEFALKGIQAGTRLMGPELLTIGPGLVAVGGALLIISLAMKTFATLKWEEIAKGLVAIGGALAVIAATTLYMGPELLVIGPGLLAVAFALTGIAAAIKLLGGSSIGTLAKGIGAIAAALIVLAGGLTLMALSLPGAAALVVAAGGLALLTPVLVTLGSLKIITIVKGLAAMGAAMLVLGAGGLAAAPGLIAVGLALGALGLGILAAGAGVNLLAKGLALLGSDGAKGVAVLVAALTAMIAVLPKMVIDFIKGIVQIVAEIAKLAPTVVAAMVTIVESILEVVIRTAPRMAVAATAIITALVTVIDQNKTRVITAAFNLLVAFLTGINNNIGRIISLGGSIIVKFLSGASAQAPKIIAAGAKAVVSFVGGITSKLPALITSATQMVVKFATEIVRNAPKLVSSAASIVAAFLNSIADRVGQVIASGVNLAVKLAKGIADNAGRLTTAGVEVITKFIAAIAKQTPKLADSGAKAVITFVHGVADAIRANSGEMGAAGADLGLAIVEGLVRGMAGAAGKAYDKAREIVDKVLGILKKVPKIFSPSKVTTEFGQYIIMGLTEGMANSAPGAYRAAGSAALGVIDTFKKVLGIQSPSKVMHEIGQYVMDGFHDGLVGNVDQIDAAYEALQGRLSDAMLNIQETLATQLAKIKDITKKGFDLDKAAFESAYAAYSKTQGILQIAKDAQTDLTGGLKIQRDTLKFWAAQFDDVVQGIKDAEEELKNATAARDDFAKSTTGNFAALPDLTTEDKNGNSLTGEEQLAAYNEMLKNRVEAVKKYRETLDALKALGLDDTTYQKLLSDGTKDQDFAKALLDGGATAVSAMKDLNGQLTTEATKLGNTAAFNLYQAGVDAANGLIKSLNDKKTEIAKTMDTIAKAMLDALTKRLKIKSPSREMMKIGRFSTEGLASGLKASASAVTKAAEKLGDDTLSAINKSMSLISEAVNLNIDSDPVITPVLDLTNVLDGARTINGLAPVIPITAAASYGQASAISSAQQASMDAASDVVPVSKTLIFEQTLNSPEALSPAEVYRQTQNQLAQAKSALDLVS